MIPEDVISEIKRWQLKAAMLESAEAKLADVAAFLDRLAERIYCDRLQDIAADCRTKARELRGDA